MTAILVSAAELDPAQTFWWVCDFSFVQNKIKQPEGERKISEWLTFEGLKSIVGTIGRTVSGHQLKSPLLRYTHVFLACHSAFSMVVL